MALYRLGHPDSDVKTRPRRIHARAAQPTMQLRRSASGEWRRGDGAKREANNPDANAITHTRESCPAGVRGTEVVLIWYCPRSAPCQKTWAATHVHVKESRHRKPVGFGPFPRRTRDADFCR
jgi:hypothetical protein